MSETRYEYQLFMDKQTLTGWRENVPYGNETEDLERLQEALPLHESQDYVRNVHIRRREILPFEKF